MTVRRRCRHVNRALIGVVCAALAVPAAAAAEPAAGGGSGGSGLAVNGGGGPGSSPASIPVTGDGGTPVSTTGDGVTLNTVSTALLRHTLTFTGTAPAGQTVQIVREGDNTEGTWLRTARATADSSGDFTATWKTREVGQFAVRANVVAPSPSVATTADATPSVTVTVYRGAKATLYGPGLYGRRTACGERLTRTTIGVANRKLRCGAQVSILYHGQTLSVPVIDRGPYANHARWDITMATADELGMTGTARIGTVVLPRTTGDVRRSSRS